MPSANALVRQFFADGVTVSIFQRDAVSNGKQRTFYSVSCRTSFFKDGKRQYTASIGERSVLTASTLIDLAYAWIVEQRRQPSKAYAIAEKA